VFGLGWKPINNDFNEYQKVLMRIILQIFELAKVVDQ